MTRRATAADPSQLLLFDAVPVAAVQPVPAQPPLHPPPPEPGAVLSTPFTEPGPAVTLSSVLAPAVFRHPQAAREIVLNSHLVAYEFKRSKRRSIGFEIGRAHV